MSKLTKFIFASDNHGELGDEDSLSALYAYRKDFKPDICVGGGDHYDCAALRKGAMDEMEGVRSLKDDFDAGKDFFARYRPTHVTWGNHEYRLESMARANRSSVVRDFCSDRFDEINRHARKCGAKTIVPYRRDKPIRVGPFTFHHGIGSDLTKMGLFWATQGGCVIVGHGHTGQQVNLPKFGRGAAFMSPCLGRLDAFDYSENRLTAAKHNNGFIAGWFKGDEWKAWIIHRLGDGKWYWQTDIKTFTP